MSEKLQEATMKALQGKLIEARNSHEAENNQIIKYHVEEYNVPDNTPEEIWNDFVKNIKKDYKLDATKENGEVYVKGTRANIISFMMNELGIADINILTQSQDDSDTVLNEKAIEDSNYIIENLKKKLIHSSNYTFKISFGGERIDIIYKNNNDASTYEFIIIEDNYYKLYASWKFSRSGYGYMGFTFKSQDIDEFINKTIIKLDKEYKEK